MVDKALIKNGFWKDGTNKVTFEFDNEEAACHFQSWLCGQGEQDYWLWMEAREQESSEDITAVSFNYHTGDETVKANCGRLDRDEE